MQMRPTICMAGDYITQAGELADSFYILKQGVAKVVCADDESVTISYMIEGSYFGEVGLLLHGKRSTSVIAQTDCVLFVISKDILMRVLNESSQHKEFMELVGNQRLETTYRSDIMELGKITNSNKNNQITYKNVNSSFENSYNKSKETIWSGIMLILVLLSIILNFFITSFAICFNVNITDHAWVIAIDIIILLIFAFDLALQFIYPDPE